MIFEEAKENTKVSARANKYDIFDVINSIKDEMGRTGTRSLWRAGSFREGKKGRLVPRGEILLVEEQAVGLGLSRRNRKINNIKPLKNKTR